MQLRSYIAALQSEHHIPIDLCLNFDQTGLRLFSTGQYTYAKQGSKAVTAIGAEDKRQITATPVVAANGEFVGLQLIYQGKTTETIRHLKATLPYVESVISSKNLGPRQKWMCLLDCYPMHKANEFTSWVAKTYPNCFLVFIPPGCTGEAQPCDQAQAWLSNQVEKTITEVGESIGEGKVDIGMRAIKGPSVEWTEHAVAWFRSQPAWEKDFISSTSVTSFNLAKPLVSKGEPPVPVNLGKRNRKATTDWWKST